MRRISLLLFAIVVSGCFFYKQQDFPPYAAARNAVGTPNRFIFDRGDFESDSVAVMSCFTPLWDLRDRTKLTLVRSIDRRVGDYEVTPLRYGVGPEELIRVHCYSGAVIGIVPR